MCVGHVYFMILEDIWRLPGFYLGLIIVLQCLEKYPDVGFALASSELFSELSCDFSEARTSRYGGRSFSPLGCMLN